MQSITASAQPDGGQSPRGHPQDGIAGATHRSHSIARARGRAAAGGKNLSPGTSASKTQVGKGSNV